MAGGVTPGAKGKNVRFGRWETLKAIGSGGQSIVYLATDTALVNLEEEIVPVVEHSIRHMAQIRPAEEPTAAVRQLLEAIAKYVAREDPRNLGAVKVLRPEIVNDPRARGRLEREVAVLSRQIHPHIVQVIDADVSAGWLVMKYYPEGSLEQHQARYCGKPLEALEALRPVIDAVTALHTQGITHRDIAPKNVFLADHGLVLGDFGLVHVANTEGTRLSETYENVGSRDWMPPWAMGLRQEEPGAAFDVFTLGKLLWAMVSGRHKLRLWYFCDREFDLAVQFPGDLRMAAINELLSRCVVEHEHDCLPSALELLAEVDAVVHAFRRGKPLLSRRQRQPLGTEVLERLAEELGDVHAVHGSITLGALEALKDLDAIALNTEVEQHPTLMKRIVGYGICDRGEAGQLALQIISTLFQSVPTSASLPWGQAARERCRELCLETLPPAIAYQVMRILPHAAQEGDIDYLAHCMGKWPEGLYRNAQPVDWLKAIYAVAPESVREMLDVFFKPGTSPEIQARAREARAVLRAVDQERAYKGISPGNLSGFEEPSDKPK